MYLHSTRGRFTPQHTDLVFPISPQFESELIALARRCITLCVRFPFVLCLLRVPVRTRPFSSPRALRLHSLPHLSCVFIVFLFISTARVSRPPASLFTSPPRSPPPPFFFC